MLEQELGKIGKTGTVVNRRLDGMSDRIDKTGASLKGMNAELGNSNKSLDVFASTSLSRTAVSANRADRSINQLTGRLRLFADAAAILGPGAIPIGGVAAGGVAGLASQLGFAAVAGGVLIGSMQGLGDALGALNKAHLEPTAENLAKAEDALNRLSPAAANFAEEAYGLLPVLREIRNMGAESLFPGLTDSLDDLERLAPVVGRIFEQVGGALGDIAADGAASLASDRWADFFRFIGDEAPQALAEMASAVGDVTHGLAELWMAFGPLNSDVSGWLVRVANDFDNWASSLSQTDGFREFIDYIRETGPQVADTLGALGNMFLQIVQAAAPLGGPTLMALEAIADAVAAIADSPIGTPLLAAASAMALLSRATSTYAVVSKTALGSSAVASIRGMGAALDTTTLATRRATTSVTAFSGANKAALTTAGKSAALLGGIAVASTGAADGFGLTNTASLALMGTIAGPWGAAVGGGVGLMLDFAAANDRAAEASASYADGLKLLTVAQLEEKAAAESNRLIEEGFGADREKLDAIIKQTAATKELEAAKAAEAVAERRSAIAFAQRAGMNVDIGNSAEVSAEQIKKQAEAFQKLKQETREAGRATAQAFNLMGDSVDDAKVSLDGWLDQQAKITRALANFNDNSLKAAREGLDKGLIRSLREMGPEGALRMQQLANGTEAGVKRANAQWRALQAEIRRTERITVQLANLSPVKMKITADVVEAMSAIERVRNVLAGLKDKTVTVRVTQTGAGVTPGFGPVGSADGGSVPKDGGPYADRFLYKLAPGEEIISNRFGQADQFRADRAAGRIPGYADGGTTGSKGTKRKASAGLFVADRTDALERAIQILTGTLEDQTAATERDIATRDEWASKMADVAQATTSGFNTGLFERDSNPWAAGSGGGPLANLTRDIAGLNERSSLQSQLAGAGLSGDALAALLGQGSNSDLSALLSSGQASQYAALYAQRAALQGSVGAAAGQQAYGREYAASDRVAQASMAEQRQMNAHLSNVQATLDEHTALLATVGDRAGSSAASAVQNGGNRAARRRRRDHGGPA